MDDLISRSALLDEIESLQVHITGLRSGKGVLADCMKEYKKSVLRIIDEQPTAYDAEKVVAELPTYEFGVSLLNTEKYVKLSDLKKKIDAIRKGGVE